MIKRAGLEHVFTEETLTAAEVEPLEKNEEADWFQPCAKKM